eukprot:UN08166
MRYLRQVYSDIKENMNVIAFGKMFCECKQSLKSFEIDFNLENEETPEIDSAFLGEIFPNMRTLIVYVRINEDAETLPRMGFAKVLVLPNSTHVSKSGRINLDELRILG